jgi:hypothetical protein
MSDGKCEKCRTRGLRTCKPMNVNMRKGKDGPHRT